MALLSQLVAELERMPEELERAARLVPPDRLGWLPASTGGIPGESFSAIGHVCHVRDIETDGYHVRIARMLDEDQPSLLSVEGYELAVERDYAHADLDDALAGFRTARTATLDRLRGLTEAQLDRSGDFAEYGALTLRGLLHYLRSHDQQHLACLHWLIGKMASAERG